MLTEQDLFNMAKDAEFEEQEEPKTPEPIGKKVVNTVRNVAGKAGTGIVAIGAGLASLAHPAPPHKINERYTI